MSLLVAIEGADGAGKNTAARNVAEALIATGISATVLSFPRYGSTVGGTALGEFLSGRLSVAVTPSSLAVLYALDRFESRQTIESAAASHDVVLFDRYIASNVAYQGAKVDDAERSTLMEWIIALEVETFGLPAPDLNVYLDTPLVVARQLMLLKDKRSYTERSYDEHESDEQLQKNVRIIYERMADKSLVGPWRTIRTVRDQRLMDPMILTADIVRIICQLPAASEFRRSAITAKA